MEITTVTEVTSIDDIRPPDSEPSRKPDAGAKAELAALEVRRLQEEVKSLRNDTKARKKYAEKIFQLAWIWLAGVSILLLMQGFQPLGWHLADSVLVTLVAGATAGVLGLMASVLAYIFRAVKPADKQKRK